MFSPPSLYAEAGQRLAPLDASWRVAMGGKMKDNQMLKSPEAPQMLSGIHCLGRESSTIVYTYPEICLC